MARLGKSQDSPSKSASKKAKRAAAKAKLDIDMEFSSDNPITAENEPVAIGASPAQIPRKPKVIPASSVAPPSPKTGDYQDMSCKPPDTATISSRFSAPPPKQDSTHDTLSVPTIRSRLSYDAIPIKYAHLLDVEDCSSKDDIQAHVELLAENRRREGDW